MLPTLKIRRMATKIKMLTETIYFYQKKIKPKAIVLACNTLTAILIEKVRKKYPNLIVVGAEPAIRPALQNSKKNVLVLATNATLKHSKLIKLFKTNNHSNVSFLKLPKLAGLIDEFYSTNPQVIQDYLAQNLAYLKGKFDAVVLGCTHYIIVGKAIKNILGNVTLYNGNYGITKRLMVCLDIMKIKNFGGKKGKTTLISTDEKRKEMLLKNYTYLLKRRDELCAV